ncbi:uncharacterized protein BX663DRAFT_484762 [Cokeromyces recurvatus]|uniref:uncharacterized protein n=1 Tax=Cokeromyces recurvatus TaxID=90255 RepID=UPI00221EE255|nr:uncharacterized protein BX663DRAFT_484762 [Cokeromyces recurvatus]KAI7904650.1 hypothetical protein BX663DRAFT_484762 [Cokeromyces recurvatus]
MSFSLYGALPPSKSEKEAENTKKENKPTNSVLGGLYSSLPPPESTTISQKDTLTNAPTTTATTSSSETTTTTNTSSATTSTVTPGGWSAINKFRPVLRKPVIQAKPKLNKPFIPTGATVVSTKTITKEEKERAQLEAAKANEQNKAIPSNIDLGAIPLLTSADDVNGFRAVQKPKKKGKKGKQQAQPQPIVFNMLEDYDPHRPNDYEQYKEERKELREMQKRKRVMEKRFSRSRSRSWSRSPSKSRSPSPYSRSPSPEPISNPATNPLAIKIDPNETAEDAYMRRLMMSQQQQPRVEETSHPAHDIARKILAKYDWQEGQGLGRDENGIKEPLEVKPIGPGISAIINNSQQQQPIEDTINISNVILLTNMVGPGEVDDMLQEETADECSKYGKVERCLIFEVPKGKIPDDRAVRIFVKFAETEAAQRAVNDLNGRFFGGRVVHASFFDNTRFDKLDLAPSKEELYM